MSVLTKLFNKLRCKNAQERRDEALHEAAGNGNAIRIEELLAEGAKVDCHLCALPLTPLYFAATNGHADAVRVLLRYGANPNLLPSGDLEATPLIRATQAESLDTVKTLVEFKADLNAIGYDHRTAMHEAIWRGREDIALFLCEAGADPNTVCRLGTTPLQDAIKNNLRAAALALCAHGADATGDDAEGFPLRRALELKGWQDVVGEIDRPAREAVEAARRREQLAADLEDAAILQSALTIRKPLILKGP